MAEVTPEVPVAVGCSSPALPLLDRVAIVTGASGGIGRAVAVHLASLGARVVAAYATGSSAADLLVSELNSAAPGRAIAARADVSSPSDVRSLFDRAEAAFAARPHILVNCAGVLDPGYPALASTALEAWDAAFAVNARGAFLCAREAAGRVARGGGGRIVCLTTSLVTSPLENYGAYVASKAAVEGMVRVLAKELRGTGITANCVAPGPVVTEMFYAGKTEEMVRGAVDRCPLGRLGEAGDVAPVVGFLCTDAGGWINGQVVRVNGGSTI